MFNKDEFVSGFDKRVKALAKAESLTKDTLRDLSRELLQITQETEDIGYVNRVVAALTPMNHKTAVLFFKEFSGFNFSEDERAFSKKNKKHYDEICSVAVKQLDDPHFNMWTWAEKHLDVQPKVFKLEDVTKFAKNAIKKASDAGVSKADVLKAFIEGGIEADVLVALLDKATEQ